MHRRMRESDYTVTAKHVNLTDEQAQRYRHMTRLSRVLRERLHTFLLDLLESDAEREDEMWDDVATLFGYPSHRAVNDAGFHMMLDHQNRYARLMAQPDKKDVIDGEENES